MPRTANNGSGTVPATATEAVTRIRQQPVGPAWSRQFDRLFRGASRYIAIIEAQAAGWSTLVHYPTRSAAWCLSGEFTVHHQNYSANGLVSDHLRLRRKNARLAEGYAASVASRSHPTAQIARRKNSSLSQGARVRTGALPSQSWGLAISANKAFTLTSGELTTHRGAVNNLWNIRFCARASGDDGRPQPHAGACMVR